MGFRSLTGANALGIWIQILYDRNSRGVARCSAFIVCDDRKLSPAHEKVISDWWAKTSIRGGHPDLQFIKDARDQVLKAGSFESYATFSQSGIGELENLEVTGTDYDLAYYDENQERHDLKAAIESALNWCDRELTQIESQIR
jgi:hypothetical protein